jgi:ubiquinone biosynthesis protein Coq4
MLTLLKKIRCRILIALTHHVALPMLKHVRKAKPFPHSLQSMRSMPAESLGFQLSQMLDENDFELLSHYARHDMKHIVLGYAATEEGEVCLQSFMLGNGRVSFPVLATVWFGCITMPEHWKAMYQAFQKGRQANAIHHWDWHPLLPVAVTELRNKIFKP